MDINHSRRLLSNFPEGARRVQLAIPLPAIVTMWLQPRRHRPITRADQRQAIELIVPRVDRALRDGVFPVSRIRLWVAARDLCVYAHVSNAARRQRNYHRSLARTETACADASASASTSAVNSGFPMEKTSVNDRPSPLLSKDLSASVDAELQVDMCDHGAGPSAPSAHTGASSAHTHPSDPRMREDDCHLASPCCSPRHAANRGQRRRRTRRRPRPPLPLDGAALEQSSPSSVLNPHATLFVPRPLSSTAAMASFYTRASNHGITAASATTTPPAGPAFTPRSRLRPGWRLLETLSTSRSPSSLPPSRYPSSTLPPSAAGQSATAAGVAAPLAVVADQIAAPCAPC